MRELTHGKKQHFELNTAGRSPSKIQRNLEQMGVKGFVVCMSPSRVTVLADRADYESNRRKWNEIQIHRKTNRRC